MPNITPPFYPIIYVRGYAGNEDLVEETVATPFMGFSDGATKVRQRWTGEIQRHFFESPLIRLMKDHGYRDFYQHGSEIPEHIALDPKSVIIYRYYDQVSETFGDGERPDIPVYAKGLGQLIDRVRKQVCQGDAAMLEEFRVYLVAHSMGGLICRAFLQHPPDGTPPVQRFVDKVFTYATPHNGIDFRIINNVPGFFSRNNVNNFNREHMARYLGLFDANNPMQAYPERVDSLNGAFSTDRFFSLVGTNHKDYTVASGWSRRAVGPMSDGLVRIDNAAVQGTPRAFVHRSHSGHYGIVNSEEGYQNLTRFLFGDVRVDGVLEVSDISLPPRVQRAKDEGKAIRASYHFETIVRPRGAQYDLSRRLVEEGSAIFRTFDELCRPDQAGLNSPRHPHLFSTYLSIRNRTKNQGALVFSIDIRVQVPEYEIDGFLFLDDHIKGSCLYKETLHLAVDRDDDGQWEIRYGLDSRTPGRAGHSKADRVQEDGRVLYMIPVRSTTKPGIDAMLRLTARPWNT